MTDFVAGPVAWEDLGMISRHKVPLVSRGVLAATSARDHLGKDDPIVFGAHDGPKAAEIVQRERPDVVL